MLYVKRIFTSKYGKTYMTKDTSLILIYLWTYPTANGFKPKHDTRRVRFFGC